VAKINPVKLKQDADKLEKAGRVEQAIALYRQIVDDNTRDWNTINKIGDLYAKLNRNREAGDEYAKVADFYAKDGFLLKAIAIWKKINKLDSSALEPYLSLADLYGKQGLMMEAKSQYQIVVDEYIKRGKMRDAGDVLKKMAEIDPGDLKVRSKLADLYTREGNIPRAVDEHIAIAEELSRKGHLAEALQVLEKGLKIDSKNDRLRVEIARVHLVQKNYERAAHYLEEAVQNSPSDTQILSRLGEAYLGAKKIEEAEAIFKRLIELDPQDQDNRAQMGRVYLLQGEFDRAFDEFAPIVDKLVSRKEGDKAATLLQQLIQKNPGHIKSLLKLVEVYRVLRKDSQVASTYTELVEAYIEAGQMESAASVLEILLELEPQNQQVQTKLQFVRSKGGTSRPAPAPASPAASSFLEEEFELSNMDELPSIEEEPPASTRGEGPVVSPPPPAPRRPTIELSPPLSGDDKEFIEEHLAEGKVFRKYGLVDKATDQFESVVARFPDHLEARQELRDAYKEKGEDAKVREQWLALAEIHRLKGDRPAADAAEAEALKLGPPAVPPPAAPAPPPIQTQKPAPPEEEVEIPLEEGGLEPAALEAETSDVSLDLDEGGQDQELPSHFIEEEAEPVEPPSAPSPEAPPTDELALETAEELEAPPAPTPRPAPARAIPLVAAPVPREAAPLDLPQDLQRVLDEVDSFISVGFVEDAKDALREVALRYPGHPGIAEKIQELGLDQELLERPVLDFESSEVPLGDALGDLGEVELSVEEPAEPEPSAPPFSEASEVPEPSEPSFEEELDSEAALVEPESEPALPETSPLLEPSVPEDSQPSFSESALGSEPSYPEEPRAEAQGIDLGVELGELFGAQSATPSEAPSTDLGDAGLADIFKEFKKGVDKQLDKEDYDTRYNLGIAYKEMGLVDEAIAEFQLAAKDTNRLLECSSMLGICFMEKGMPKLAVKWFEKGLKAPGRLDEEYHGLRYDLAMALEAAGETDKALNLYTDLYGQDANFRDVAAKLRDLKASLG
jgi:pilus assembly protein FimV